MRIRSRWEDSHRCILMSRFLFLSVLLMASGTDRHPHPSIVPKSISGHGMFLCGQLFLAKLVGRHRHGPGAAHVRVALCNTVRTTTTPRMNAASLYGPQNGNETALQLRDRMTIYGPRCVVAFLLVVPPSDRFRCGHLKCSACPVAVFLA